MTKHVKSKKRDIGRDLLICNARQERLCYLNCEVFLWNRVWNCDRMPDMWRSVDSFLLVSFIFPLFRLWTKTLVLERFSIECRKSFVFALALLHCDWLKNSCQFFSQPIRSKTKIIHNLSACVFPRLTTVDMIYLFPVLIGSLCCFRLSAVIGQINSLGFTTHNWKLLSLFRRRRQKGDKGRSCHYILFTCWCCCKMKMAAASSQKR